MTSLLNIECNAIDQHYELKVSQSYSGLVLLYLKILKHQSWVRNLNFYFFNQIN